MIGTSNSGSKGAGIGSDIRGDRGRSTSRATARGEDGVIWIFNYPTHNSAWLQRAGDTGDGGGEGNYGIKSWAW